MNKEHPQSAENEESQPFTEENVKLLWKLTSGIFDEFEDFEKILTDIYAPKEPPVSIAVAKELLAITSGNFKNVQSLPFVEEQTERPGTAPEESKLP